MSLEGRHILLGITGSIAAYKAAILCRLLKGAGAEVKVVMTPLAKQFITPLTMATLSKHPILVEFFNPENGEWNSHVSLGEWADCLLIDHATAYTLVKKAHDGPSNRPMGSWRADLRARYAWPNRPTSSHSSKPFFPKKKRACEVNG